MPTFALDALPDTVHAGRIRYETGWRNASKGLNHPALYYLFTGKLCFSVDGKSVPLTAGTAFLMDAGHPYSVRAEEDCDYCYFHFFTAGTDGAMPDASVGEGAGKIHFEKPQKRSLPPREAAVTLPALEPIVAHREQVEHLATAALRHAACARPFDKVRLDLTLLRLLLLLGEGSAEAERENGASESRNTYLAIRESIETHYTAPVSLASVSREMQISPQYASRVFRRHAGCSITAFIQSVRLSRSEELLRYTALSVSEIAFAVGFSSPYYYSRVFSRVYGTTPTAFRRAAREEL